jgi:hypothetical protein
MVFSMALAASAVPTGCESDDGSSADVGGGAAVPEPIEEGCEHAAKGPFAPSVAAADAATAPSVTEPHKAHVVTLTDVTGGKGGVVTYASSEAGDYLLMLGAEVPIAVAAPDGSAVEIESTEAVDTCAEVAVAHTVELGVGTYTFTFGPTAEATVTLVVEESAHAEAHP